MVVLRAEEDEKAMLYIFSLKPDTRTCRTAVPGLLSLPPHEGLNNVRHIYADGASRIAEFDWSKHRPTELDNQWSFWIR